MLVKLLVKEPFGSNSREIAINPNHVREITHTPNASEPYSRIVMVGAESNDDRNHTYISYEDFDTLVAKLGG